ncbi:MAG: noncanonical pyrimidine nucleotidase, YjjG family [bacterium]|nr:noncanonical pyrimidine nucleotidase, YjjG family [bacterium]
MTYSTLLFDLDHTLLDSVESERLAFEAALAAAGIARPFDYFSVYSRINRALWAAVERQEIVPDDVRVTRFEQLVDQTDLDADPVALADELVAGLGAYGQLYPGSRDVLDSLKGTVALAMVTNGIGEVQRARIERLDLEGYFGAIAISGELGTSKPGTDIFDFVFEALGFPSKGGTLMIGDSLASDIQGGNNFGIATCWYNPDGQPAGSGVRFTHEIGSLREVLDLTVVR